MTTDDDSDDYPELESADYENQPRTIPQDEDESDDDIDITSIVTTPAPARMIDTTYRATHPAENTLGSVQRRTVNVYTDEGIWILLDEGCNSNCHGREWARNTEENSENMDSSLNG